MSISERVEESTISSPLLSTGVTLQREDGKLHALRISILWRGGGLYLLENLAGLIGVFVVVQSDVENEPCTDDRA